MFGRRNSQQYSSNGSADSRVIRSEVWSCFDLDGLNAICRACNERLKVGPTRQTSSLWRHLKRHNREGKIGPNGMPKIVHRMPQPYNSHSRTPITTYSPLRKEQQPVSVPSTIPRVQPSSTSAAGLLSPSASSSSQKPPLVTVDCKPVDNLALDQLLGIQRDQNGGEEGPDDVSNNHDGFLEGMDDDVIEEGADGDAKEEDGGMAAAGHSNGTVLGAENGQQPETQLLDTEQTLAEFLLENGLPFRRVLSDSPTLARLLGGLPQLPSPRTLIHQLVPRLFADALNERKFTFNDDFFVLTLNRLPPLENPRVRNVHLLGVSALKLSDSFALCHRPIGVFAYRGDGTAGMRGVLQRCFEQGHVELRLWQVSAIVHDGSADLAELCAQLDIPGVPSARALIRAMYAELDRLEFPTGCVRRVKARFEQALGDVLSTGTTTENVAAFSVIVPTLVMCIDQFFGQSAAAEQQKTTEQRLIEKFRSLWSFQRQKLLEGEAQSLALFLNPNTCQRDSLYNDEEWKQIGARLVEQIAQACSPGAEGEQQEDASSLRADIEAEVRNYVETALTELWNAQPQTFQSLNELLFWWRINAGRFPRLVQMSRQFCAVPLCGEPDGDWRRARNKQRMKTLDTRNVEYANELLNRDLGEVEDVEEKCERLTQLMCVRMAVLEKNGGERLLMNGFGE